MSAIVAAVSNLKGGVGKSTTTLMLADGLAYYYGANVLVIDLDPQANSTQMMLTEEGIQLAFENGKGVHHLLRQFSRSQPPNLAGLIQPNAVSLEELRKAEDKDRRQGWMSILASHPQVRLTEMEIEDEVYGRGTRPRELAGQLAKHLDAALDAVRPLYDVILIDTPPYLSPLARAALTIAQKYITPTLADPVSIWGTKQFSDWMRSNVPSFSADNNFVVITRFKNSRMAQHSEHELRNIYLKDRVFGPTIPESVQALQAMERASIDSYISMRAKYGSLRANVRKLAQSFAEFIAESNGVQAPEPVRS